MKTEVEMKYILEDLNRAAENIMRPLERGWRVDDMDHRISDLREFVKSTTEAFNEKTP